MANEYTIILYAGGALIAYLYLCNRVAALVQPARLEVAIFGEQLLKRDDLRPIDRANIGFLMDHVYSRRLAWLLAAAVVPAVIFISWRRIFDRSNGGIPTGAKLRIGRFTRLAIISVLASSPFAALLFSIQFAIMLLLYLPVGRSLTLIVEMADQIWVGAGKLFNEHAKQN
ncbi:hypothetical protein [Oricola indica]|uniref:hypothetical protein n=1 Tax=Oricola indica TaxID=2872591 RepID=UPI003CCC057F